MPGGVAGAQPSRAAPYADLRLLQMPSRLWRCALTLALQGKALRAIPAALRLAPLQSPPNRLRRIGNTEAVAVHRSVQEIHAASSLLHVRPPGRKGMAGSRSRASQRASLRESRPLRASIADAYGPASSFGPARFACVQSAQRDGRCLSSHLS